MLLPARVSIHVRNLEKHGRGKECIKTNRLHQHDGYLLLLMRFRVDIFCVGCANKAFGTALVCPACETSLTQQYVSYELVFSVIVYLPSLLLKALVRQWTRQR